MIRGPRPKRLMFSHIVLGANDLSRAIAFYDQVMAAHVMTLISTRGNSGEYDGVFWLEQVRTKTPGPSFIPARNVESRHLPLPPDNWLEKYDRRTTHIAPIKVSDKP